MLTASVVALSLISFFMASFVLARNSRDDINKSFAIFAYITSVWMLANYIGANFKNHTFARYFIYTDFIVGPVLTYSYWWLTRNFLLIARPGKRKVENYIAVFFLLANLGAALSTLSPFFVDVQIINNGVRIDYGSFFSLYSAVAILGVALAFYNLITASKKASGRLRAQMRLMLTGLTVLAVLLVFANAVVPELTTSASVNLDAGNLAYVGIMTFEITTFYAIIRHRLFDIRLAIVRTVGFLVTMLVVALIYTLLVIGIGAPLISNGRITLIKDSFQLLLLIPPTIFIAFTFHSLQRYIAKLTRRVFYQDSYETQRVLDALSDALITESDMSKIMRQSLKILGSAIKPSSSAFVVCNNEGEIYHRILVERDNLPPIDSFMNALRHKAGALMKDDPDIESWPEKLEAADISLLIRLGSIKSLTGVLLFGPKQNGRIYTQQDIDLLQISTKNLGIAIENAKKYEQIAQFADTMHQEVLRATADLRRANQELKTLDAMKDDFISMASHQLRTPATSVHEAIQMLNEGKLTRSERRRLLDLSEASSEHLVNVVADMLSIARIQAGRFSVDKTKVNIQELIKRAMDESVVVADQKQIKIIFKDPGEAIETQADRAKLNEAISNYLDNATQYSEPGSSITITARKVKDRINVEVCDTGIGVPPSERKNLFTKFYRARNAKLEHPDGNGIGLFVVKTIARAHGGEAYYKPLEHGSLFGFWIPLR